MKLYPFTLLLLLAAEPPIGGQNIQVNKDNRTIAITTSDEAEATADTAIVTVGFNVYGLDQNGTYAEGSRVSNNIMKALHEAGIADEAIESANQSLNAIDDSDKQRYIRGIRFTFLQSWHVTTGAKKAAEILHIAITSGANDSGGIQWKLTNEDALEAEAAQKALSHAQQIAAQMAKGLHASLGSLIYASNQTPPRTFFGGGGGTSLNTQTASVAMKNVNLKPLVLAPEKIQRSATVYAVFAIE